MMFIVARTKDGKREYLAVTVSAATLAPEWVRDRENAFKAHKSLARSLADTHDGAEVEEV